MAGDGAPERPGAQRWVPERVSHRALTEAVQECRGCELGASRGALQDWPVREDVPVPAGVPEWVLATAHPSSVLRSRSREEDYAALVRDLAVAANTLDLHR